MPYPIGFTATEYDIVVAAVEPIDPEYRVAFFQCLGVTHGARRSAPNLPGASAALYVSVAVAAARRQVRTRLMGSAVASGWRSMASRALRDLLPRMQHRIVRGRKSRSKTFRVRLGPTLCARGRCRAPGIVA